MRGIERKEIIEDMKVGKERKGLREWRWWSLLLRGLVIQRCMYLEWEMKIEQVFAWLQWREKKSNWPSWSLRDMPLCGRTKWGVMLKGWEIFLLILDMTRHEEFWDKDSCPTFWTLIFFLSKIYFFFITTRREEI